MSRACALSLSLIVAAAPAVRAAEAPPAATETAAIALLPNGLQARHGPLLLRTTALTDDIVRVRLGRDGALPEDSSWAVLPEMRARHAVVAPLQNGFATRDLRVTVDPASFSLTVTDPSGRLIV